MTAAFSSGPIHGRESGISEIELDSTFPGVWDVCFAK
jgi:hypothetical protein